MKEIEKKLWYTLNEVSQRLSCSVEHVLYLGMLSKLQLSFDWVVFNDQNHDAGSRLEFTCSRYIIEDGSANYREPLRLPFYHNDPYLRFAALDVSQIALLNKQQKIKLKQGLIGDVELDINPVAMRDEDAYLVLTIDDVVVSEVSLNHYIAEYAKSKPAQESEKPTHQQQKELDNTYKTIALFALRLAEEMPIKFTKNGNLNISALAEDVVSCIPVDNNKQQNSTGLSVRTICQRITKGSELLES